MIGRVTVGAIGSAVAIRGLWMLLTNQRLDQLFSAGLWLGGGVIAHDAVIAPTVIVLGWLLLRAVPMWARGAVAAGGLVLGTLTLVAVPMLGGWGRRPDNTSLLPRDYVHGWVIVAAIVVICSTATALAVRSRQSVRR